MAAIFANDQPFAANKLPSVQSRRELIRVRESWRSNARESCNSHPRLTGPYLTPPPPSSRFSSLTMTSSQMYVTI